MRGDPALKRYGAGCPWMRKSIRTEDKHRFVCYNIPDKKSPLGYPAEERPQQDRFDAARIHWVE